MSSTSILQGKRAVIFGAGGSIGTAVAREFAAEGAEVFISGRMKSSVEAVAHQIIANSGKVHATVVDTLNDAAVNEYVDDVVKQAGRIDTSSMLPVHSPKTTATGKSPWTCRLSSSWCRWTRW